MPIAKFSDVQKAIKNNEDEVAKETAEQERLIDAFINGAPDGRMSKRTYKESNEDRRTELGKKWKLKGRKVVITHTLDPEDLVRLDNLVKAHGTTRAAFLNALIRKAILADEMDEDVY